MNVVRGIIRAIVSESSKTLAFDPKLSYIGNYDDAERFAKDFLKLDIPDLEHFHLNDYLPKESKQREVWSFDASTMGGLQMNITVERKMVEGESFWRLIYSEAWNSSMSEPMQASVVEDTGWIRGYDEFKKVTYRLSSSWVS